MVRKHTLPCATCIYFEFWLATWISCDCFLYDWLSWLLRLWFQSFAQTIAASLNATYPNIAVSEFASSGQTVATLLVWSPCCNALRHVVDWKSNKFACLGTTLLQWPGQTTTTSCTILKLCMTFLAIFKFEPTTPNMSQQGGQTRAICCAQ